MPRTAMPLGGIDLGPVSLPEADAFADLLVGTACRVGVDPTALIVGTHRIVAPDGPVHVVVTVGAPLTGEGCLWRLCSTAVAARDGGVQACAVGRHTVGDGASLDIVRSGLHERSLGLAGRCVYFPGVEALAGTMTVGQIIAASAIEAVEEVGGGRLDAPAEIVTGAHVRPRWEFGVLTLHVQDEGAGLYLPFERAPALRVR